MLSFPPPAPTPEEVEAARVALICTQCSHPAREHEGDGWGGDETGTWDWFACFEKDCDCRIKGFLTRDSQDPSGWGGLTTEGGTADES